MIDEKEYRKLNRLSYSSLKLFDTNRTKFYRREILKDYSEEEAPSTAILLGSIVDCKLFSPKEFDDRFHIATCLHPTGQMGEFVDELCTITLQSLDQDYKVTRDLTEMMEEAFKAVKYDVRGAEVKFKGKDFAWLVKNFVGTDAENYYKECRSQFGKDVVDLNLVSAADKIIEELQQNEWTKDIINATSTRNVEVFDQEIVLFDIHGELFKSMLDRVFVDHVNKTITPYDLKITYTGEDFQYNYWKMKYYLQSAVYWKALFSWKKENGWEKYDIDGLKFIVGSSNLQSNPLIYHTSDTNVLEGLHGFTLPSGKHYKGVYDIIEEIKWHKKHQLWRNSKDVYIMKGQMTIKPFEQVEEV